MPPAYACDMVILACPKRLFVVTLLAAFGLAAAGCAGTPPGRDVRSNPHIERMTPEQLARLEQQTAPHPAIDAGEILRLNREGRSAEQIVAILRNSGAPPRLGEEQRKALAAQGVATLVLEWLADAERRAAQTDAIDTQVQRETAEARAREEREARERQRELRAWRQDPFYSDPFHSPFYLGRPLWPGYWNWQLNYPPRSGIGLFWISR